MLITFHSVKCCSRWLRLPILQNTSFAPIQDRVSDRGKDKCRVGIDVEKLIPTARRNGDNMIDLSGKVAAVTGAAGGIGAKVARTLAKAPDP